MLVALCLLPQIRCSGLQHIAKSDVIHAVEGGENPKSQLSMHLNIIPQLSIPPEAEEVAWGDLKVVIVAWKEKDPDQSRSEIMFHVLLSVHCCHRFTSLT